MSHIFRFYLRTELVAGVGVHCELADVILKKNFCRCLLVVDENVQSSNPMCVVRDALGKNNILTGELSVRGTEEPDYDYLDLIAEQARQKEYDLVIGVGGGSTLDLAKGIGILLTNPGRGIDYRGFDRVSVPGVPVMAVPTTAGTGSEVTVNAVFTDKTEKRKLGVNGQYLDPSFAVLDPHFTSTAPLSVAISSGMDALVHALEGFVGSNAPPTNFLFSQRQDANSLTRPFACEAFRLLFHHLPVLVDDPGNLDRLLKIQLGAYFAGVSLFNTSSGIAGAISYPLGVHYKIPHGIAGGMLALPVVEYNVRHGYQGYAQLYDLIEGVDRRVPNSVKNQHFIEELRGLVEKLAVPEKFSHFGIEEESYEHVIEIMQGLQAAFDQNPVPLKVENVGVLLAPFFNRKHRE